MESSKKQPVQRQQDVLAEKFPGLAMPNDARVDTKVPEKNKKTKKENISSLKNENVVDDAMAALEALAPSYTIREEEGEKVTRTSSPELKKSNRDEVSESKSKRKLQDSLRSRSAEKSSRKRSRSRSGGRDHSKRFVIFPFPL